MLSEYNKLCYPQGKPTHNKHLQRKLFCHSKHCEETSPESPASPLFCHSEGLQPRRISKRITSR
ncbi:hypothetical protein [Helicobacter marmotae]|uniref:hypothetical protein n=1 Tax=Helicobacter marmotae TaxID=152490 RepID=UPI0011C058B7|nr:hypothetical protein [Helicobacter marmotae]